MEKANNTHLNDNNENEKASKNDVAARARQSINKARARAINKNSVSDNFSGVYEKNNQKSETSPEVLTEQVNKPANKTGADTGRSGHRTENVLNASSEYLKNFDLAETTQQVKKTIKQNPGVSFAIAGIFGLLIGLLVGRRTLR